MWSRRQFIVVGAGAMTGLLAACSREGSSGSPGSSAASAPLDGRIADVTAHYTAGETSIRMGGAAVSTWAYDAAVPGALLRARAGDVVEVIVDNQLPEPTSVHWHGLAIVNAMDGVPDVTQPPIAPSDTFTYRFVVPHPGTYWFHPHHGLQLERGLYAPFVVEDPDEHVVADVEYVVVLDDWLDGTGTTPEAEDARIRAAAMDMGSMGSMDHSGMSGASSTLLGGDAGDAEYPYHLVNGRPPDDPATLEPLPRPGDRVRLRVINAAADTAYRVAVGGHRLTVTHADGFPVVPVDVDTFLIGMGERYDVTFVVGSGAWPVVALAEGKQQRAGAILRTTDANPTTVTFDAPELNGVMLRYADLAAHERVRLTPADTPEVIDVALTGGMMMWDWGINGDRFADAEPIEIVAGRWYVLRIVNDTTMWHPMHLHGHTPQLGRAPGGVRKDTVNVLPGSTVELAFLADNPGSWMLHCHNAYHLEAGMATLLRYVS